MGAQKSGHGDQPRNALGEFEAVAETAIEGDAAEEAEGLTEAETAEFHKHDAALDKAHDDIAATHAEIAEHMAKLKELHAKLGKHLDKAQAHSDRLNELDEKQGNEPVESDIIDAGREQHEHLGEALEQHKDDAKKMRAALKANGMDKAMKVERRLIKRAASADVSPMEKALAVETDASSLADKRQVRVICSTGQIDRTGDIVVQSGIDVGNFKASRTVLWNHDHDHPVAACVDIGVKANRLEALVQFPDAGVSVKADEVYGLLKAGVINAVSIGFLPTEMQPVDAKNPRKGMRIDTSELLEFSFVSVPANPGATVMQRGVRGAEKVALAMTRKGLFHVAALASMLGELGWVADSTATEAAYEGDGSAVPAMMADALKQLGQVLIAMTAEEVAELVSGDAKDPIDEPMLASMAKLIGGVGKRVEKAGRTYSAANEQKMRGHLDTIDKAMGDIKGAHKGMCQMLDDATPDPADDPQGKAAPSGMTKRQREADLVTLGIH